MNPEKDKYFIKRCFKLARRGIAKVSPNPLVGAVITKDDRMVSEGWHTKPGADHAEAMAIKKAGGNLKGATLYCNLEPCCHIKKKTPPCLPLVISSGIKRVVLSNGDPNPQVSGMSIKLMRKAGIEVIENILEKEGRELNRFFFKHIVEQKPWVTLKIAQTMDAKISKGKNTQTWITGKEAARYVHMLRATYDAILVGAGTIISDNPQLDVRHVKGRDPLKIIIDGQLSSNTEAHILKKGATWIFHDKTVADQKTALFNGAGTRLFPCACDDTGQIDLNNVLSVLGKSGINSLLVEGGHKVFSQFISHNLFDEIIVLQAPIFFGNGLPSAQFPNKIDLKFYESRQLGEDYYLNLRKKD